jgi:hypothetical protein
VKWFTPCIAGLLRIIVANQGRLRFGSGSI